jgi:type I restriction enzyme S subunit
MRKDDTLSLPKGWEIKKLEDLCTSINGLWKGKNPPFCEVGVIRNTNFTKSCLLDFSNIAYMDVELKQFNSRKLYKGDLIIEKSGGGPKQPVGRAILFEKEEGEYSFSNFTSVLRINDRTILDYKYLHIFLLNKYLCGDTEKIQSNTIGLRNLDFNKYKEFNVQYPNLQEQQRIVQLLNETFDKIDTLKYNAGRNLQNAKELFESYLQNEFKDKLSGSKFDSLDNLCELIVDCEHKTAPTQDTGYPSIRTPNIGKGNLILDDVNRVSYETYLQWTRRAIPKSGDLILAREAPAGNIAVIPENVEVCLGQRTVLIRPKKDKFESKYLAYLILSKDVQKHLLSHSRGATVEHVNMKDIRAFKIYNLIPCIEQQAIVQKLDILFEQCSTLETNYQKTIVQCEDMRKAILAKAFNGEL